MKPTGKTLSVELGPGLLQSIYDGVQRPLKVLEEKSGRFLARGIEADGLDHNKKWDFVPTVSKGDKVNEGDVLGTVQETSLILHKVMVPVGIKNATVDKIESGHHTVTEIIAVLTGEDGKKIDVEMRQYWPIRNPRKVTKKRMPNTLLKTGGRSIDMFFPLVHGGAACIPGPFGSGKTVTQQTLAKYCDAQVIVYIGCGERGNEMTEVLNEFPELIDPNSGEPLMRRTVMIANTSNMPVAAREASVYTGITIAEYYRDMGFDVMMTADSTSRWAEAMRELSSRLEEMPGEEGYPAYLGARLADFYERSGRVTTLEGTEGSVSIVGAVSLAGGFTEDAAKGSTVLVRVTPAGYLVQEIDLGEEVARSHGVGRLTASVGVARPAGSLRRRQDVVQTRIRSWFVHSGYQELVTSTFFADGDLEKLGLPEDDPRRVTLSVINPRHGGNTQLRSALLPSFLDVARRNLNAGAPAPVRYFQSNRVFWPGQRPQEDFRHEQEKQLPREPLFLQFGGAGRTDRGLGDLPADLLEIKGVVEATASTLRIDLALEPGDGEPCLAPGAQWRILDVSGRCVGSAGRVKPSVSEAFGLEVPAAVAEINLDDLDLTPKSMKFQPFGRFPGVTRDLSLLVPAGLSYGSIEAVVTENGGPLLGAVEIFDIYRGKGVPEGLGAYGIRLKFRSDKGNLKGKAVDKAVSEVLKALADRLNIEPRGLD